MILTAGSFLFTGFEILKRVYLLLLYRQSEKFITALTIIARKK